MEGTLTPEVTTQTISVYAGFWRRVAASILDSLIISAGLGILILIFVLIFWSGFRDFFQNIPHAPPPGDTAAMLKFELSIWPVIIGFYVIECVAISGTWLYHAFQEAGKYQATIGKRAMNLIVTDLEGYPISFGRATGRYFAKGLSSMTLGIGYILPAFTKKKQALHDMIANTIVQHVIK